MERPPHTIESERREQEPVEKARMFLFQSVSPENIPDDADVASLTFTNSIWVMKSADSASPLQIMPIGGTVRDGEEPFKAAIRQSVEKTHVRPPERSIRQFGTTLDHQFDHPDKGRVDHHTSFFKGKLSAPNIDILYALDKKSDKIDHFLTLSVAQTKELTEFGGVIIDDEIVPLLDSLSPNADDREAYNTTVNEVDRSAVMDEVVMHMLATDARKKMQLLKELVTGLNADPVKGNPDKERIYAPFRYGGIDAENPGKVPDYIPAHHEYAFKAALQWQQLWKQLTAFEGHSLQEAQGVLHAVDEFWKEYSKSFSVADVRMALEHSDFAGAINNAKTYKLDSSNPDRTPKYRTTYHPEKGSGVPTMTLLFPLLADGDLNITKLRTLVEDPQARKLLKSLQVLKRAKEAYTYDGEVPDDGVLLRELVDSGLARLDPSFELGVVSADEVDFYTERFAALGEEIDIYFEKLRDVAGLTDEDAPIDQLDAVKAVSLVKLLELANGEGDEFDGLDEYDSRVLRFEAGRKISLTLLLNDAAIVRKRIKNRGVVPINRVQEQLFNNGLSTKYPDLTDWSRTGPKDLMSLMRKLIVRDQILGEGEYNDEYAVAKDVYASSLIAEGTESIDAIPQDHAIPPDMKITDRFGEELTVLRASQVEADIIFGLLQHGEGTVEIIDYKPMPEDGEAVMSEGPGGGAKLRFSKFYIRHTDDTGIVRYKEMQIFIPNPVTGKSAEDEFIAKKDDDKRYGVSRLFGTKGVRSFMELMFPAQIYDGSRGDGDVRAMYRSHKNELG